MVFSIVLWFDCCWFYICVFVRLFNTIIVRYFTSMHLKTSLINSFYLVNENLSDMPKSLVEVGYAEADITGILV